jgi:hypothetical protein
MEDYWFPIANTILGVRQSAERVEALSVDQGSLGGEGPESRIRGEIEYVSVEAITLGGDFLSLGGGPWTRQAGSGPRPSSPRT